MLKDNILFWSFDAGSSGGKVEPAFAEEAAAHRGRVQAVRVVSCVSPQPLAEFMSNEQRISVPKPTSLHLAANSISFQHLR